MASWYCWRRRCSGIASWRIDRRWVDLLFGLPHCGDLHLPHHSCQRIEIRVTSMTAAWDWAVRRAVTSGSTACSSTVTSHHITPGQSVRIDEPLLRARLGSLPNDTSRTHRSHEQAPSSRPSAVPGRSSSMNTPCARPCSLWQTLIRGWTTSDAAEGNPREEDARRQMSTGRLAKLCARCRPTRT
jgi:hypothetical protein